MHNRTLSTEYYLHVVPTREEHITQGLLCKCKPRLDDGIVIHNSYDGREFYELDNLNVLDLQQRFTESGSGSNAE